MRLRKDCLADRDEVSVATNMVKKDDTSPAPITAGGSATIATANHPAAIMSASTSGSPTSLDHLLRFGEDEDPSATLKPVAALSLTAAVVAASSAEVGLRRWIHYLSLWRK
ncbi:hypothetical protein U9M48_033992 [Paspalum notatum var. saurae]|uniref:Uncharacterized protein n=1 Tax=Paspalum notatum var. saurae TaxID=547442 RepID=A0AAQ3U888_PASNO